VQLVGLRNGIINALADFLESPRDRPLPDRGPGHRARHGSDCVRVAPERVGQLGRDSPIFKNYS
jgi:hypothetical protein